MQITTFSDYCLRILIFLATSDEEQASARQIAECYGISVHHIAKASQLLVRQGHLTATRGKGGGLKLARSPKDIPLGQVIREVEESSGLVECMRVDGRCAISSACGLAPLLDEARDAFFNTLDKYSLAAAIRQRSGIAQLLRMSESLRID